MSDDELSPFKSFQVERRKKMIAMYQEGLKTREIAERLYMKTNTVYQQLFRAGVEMRPQGRPRIDLFESLKKRIMQRLAQGPLMHGYLRRLVSAEKADKRPMFEEAIEQLLAAGQITAAPIRRGGYDTFRYSLSGTV